MLSVFSTYKWNLNTHILCRYEAEQFARREADDQLTQLRQKHDFNQHVTTQEKNDLSDRLHRASNTIVTLETKVFWSFNTAKNLLFVWER